MLSDSDAHILVLAADDGNTAIFRDMMEREDGSGRVLKSFFEAHSAASCAANECAPHTHLGCFVDLVYDLSHGQAKRLIDVLNYFNDSRGSPADKYNATMAHFLGQQSANYGLPQGLPAPIAAILQAILGGGENEQHEGAGFGFGPNGERYVIRVSGYEVVVQGDYQPSQDSLFETLERHVPHFKQERSKYRIRRVNDAGVPIGEAIKKMEPLQPGMNFDFEENIKVEECGFADSFSDMIEKLKAMK